MLSRDLLVDAVESCTRAGFGSAMLVQRKVRVGFATANQLVFALEDAGVLGPVGERHRRPVHFAKDEAIAAVDKAIADGLIVLDVPVGSSG